MNFDFEFPDDARREMQVLSRWARAALSKGDRNIDEKILGSTIDDVTGLVKSKADLKPDGEALCGPDYVFQGSNMQPDEMALEHLSRTEHDGTQVILKNARAWGVVATVPDLERPGTTKELPALLKTPLHEKGRAEEEVLYQRKQNPDWKVELRLLQGRTALTEEENRATKHLKYLYEKTLRSMADKGWIALEPTLSFSSVGPEGLPGQDYKKGVDDRGGIFWARVLPAGLDEALKRCGNDPYWGQGAFSSLEGQSPDVKAAAVQRNPWAHQSWLDE